MSAAPRTGSARRAPRSADKRPFLEISLADARQVPRRDLVIRFAFGAAISVAAAVIALVMGVRVGGLLLAFPAILPATLTLIEKEDGEHKALEDDVGSVLGAVALAVFGLLAWWLIPRAGPALALVAACAGWLVSALLLYVGLRAVFGAGGR